MFYSTSGIVILLLLQSVLSQQPVPDKYTDENRPYKFGFNIDGYQHRKEEKNEKGIIKGEYGFITADGYYRVTKYETDENGKFKIISMKNYYVGFPPENPTTTPSASLSQNSGRPKIIKTGQQTSRPIPVKIVDSDVSNEEFSTSPRTESSEKRKSFNFTPTTSRFNIFQGQSGCSHCIIPTTSTTSKPSNPNEFSVDYRIGINLFENSTPKQLKSGKEQTNKDTEKQTLRKNVSAFKNNGDNKISGPNQRKNNDKILKKNFNFPKSGVISGEPKPNIDPRDGRNLQKTQDLFGFKNFSQPIENPTKSKLSDKLKEININNLRTGQRLNPTNDQKDFLVENKNKLLYTFNYTLGFNGHHENGFRNGDKEGDYFFDGKDGTKRNVTYIANEFGYQPNITLTDLNDNEKRRFDDDNEKNNNELKGYEFKWFYTRRK